MDSTSATTALIQEFGPIITVTALLAGLVQQLVRYILKETVARDIYDNACDTHGKIETAVDHLAESVSEVTYGQTTTNKLLEILLKEDIDLRRR